MSKYNRFAKELEAAFKKSREKYAKAAAAVDEAEQERRRAEYMDEKFMGEKAAKIALAEARLRNARVEFEQVDATAWQDFRKEQARIAGDLREAIKRDQTVNPDAVDASALVLLQAGLCSADDLSAMVNRYADNFTMLRLIGNHAADRKESAGKEESAKLAAVKDAVSRIEKAPLEAWQQLEYAANVCSGQAHGRGERSYTVQMNNRWEELVAPAVESF